MNIVKLTREPQRMMRVQGGLKDLRELSDAELQECVSNGQLPVPPEGIHVMTRNRVFQVMRKSRENKGSGRLHTITLWELKDNELLDCVGAGGLSFPDKVEQAELDRRSLTSKQSHALRNAPSARQIRVKAIQEEWHHHNRMAELVGEENVLKKHTKKE